MPASYRRKGMAVKLSMRVLGFMTGTSLDACDMAILETDGETIAAFGPAGERKLTDATRDIVLEATRQALAWPRGAPEPEVFKAAAAAVAREHFEAAEGFLAEHRLAWSDIDLMGMHGQTVLHERPQAGRVGRTVQLGDAQWLADAAGVPVAYDFRTADVAAGGEGAPLAPIYHLARARTAGLRPPLAILNVGGVANITFWSETGDIAAFDTGPGNGMIDLLVQARGAGRYDAGGKYASVGKVDETVLRGLLAHPYFKSPPPKSLDRHDFPLAVLEKLQLEDAAATLVAFTAEAVRLGFELMGGVPTEMVVCGGGRRNPQLMKAFAERLSVPVTTAEDHDWRGDSIEAEAFAYLAARTLRGLAISYPKTTGVPAPMTGGRIAQPTV
ncbi:anhydro-N-acetylmuramic acid kinase [Phenylobacterium sp.]|uniref:anhydro-N-acetylmuramic acid kinase n=1 Tax=Phenylobacterium sp. TaxID=1871053 RepID=UPI002736E828|nr:anhydro-N-acetylmuramic acid kinase [Phenylobacterium sp.]MDP3855507.1 anhydro-N-acetylmuramic acid kinase [Phenylobacterium sp.]